LECRQFDYHRPVRPTSSLALDLALIALLGFWRGDDLAIPRAHRPRLVVSGAIAYIVFGVLLYIRTRHWIPMVLPVFGPPSRTFA